MIAMYDSPKSLFDDMAKPTRRWREGDILFAENDWVKTADVVSDDPKKLGGLGLGLHPYGDSQMCVGYITAEQAKAWGGCEDLGKKRHE